MEKPDRRVKHHRHPKSRRHSYSGANINEDRNISKVRYGDHVNYHALFGNMLPPEMAAMLNDVWISRDYYLVAIPRTKRPTKRRRKRVYCEDCQCEVLKHIPKTKKGA